MVYRHHLAIRKIFRSQLRKTEIICFSSTAVNTLKRRKTRRKKAAVETITATT